MDDHEITRQLLRWKHAIARQMTREEITPMTIRPSGHLQLYRLHRIIRRSYQASDVLVALFHRRC